MGIETIRIILSSKIRLLRNSKGLTQERLAEKVNIHATYISRIESSRKIPTLPIICNIADALGVDVYELFVNDKKIGAFDYKKKKLINIVNESVPANIDLYSTLLGALHQKHKRGKK